jgi:hypothetical protein
MEGALKNRWEFKDKASGDKAIAEYLARRDGKSDKVIAPSDNEVK